MLQQLLEAVKDEIAKLQQVVDLLEEGGTSSYKRGKYQKRKTMSLSARAKIGAAQRKRWAVAKNGGASLKGKGGWPKTKAARSAESKRRKLLAKLKTQSKTSNGSKNYPAGGVA